MNKQLVKLTFAAKAVLREKQADANADLKFEPRSQVSPENFEEGRWLGLDNAVPKDSKRIRAILDAWNEHPLDSKDPMTNGYRLGFRRRLVAEMLKNKDLKGTVDSEDGGYLTSNIVGTLAGGATGAGIGAGGNAIRGARRGGKGFRLSGAGKGAKAGGKYGGIAGLLLGLIGSLVANSRGEHSGRYGKLRSREDQEKYEQGSKWSNRLIPGMANYNKGQSIRYSDFV